MRYLIFLSFLLTACSPKIPQSLALDRIQIARDQWGVPHIMAPTDAEVAYGFGWAQCEDSFQTLQEQMLAIRGKYGEVEGKDGVIADLGIQFMGLREVVEARYERDLSPDFRHYLEQYVAGINNYAALHPDEILLKKLFPVQPQDVVMGYLMGLVELSQARPHLEAIMGNQILPNTGPNFPKGSNAIAISANKTTDGKIYLAINSHQPLEGWYSWYEAHLLSEEGLNILGGTFPGGATIFHGVNENLGWAHTVNHVDLSDIYQLEMHPEDDLRYRYDKEWLELEEVTYRAKAKIGPLKLPIKRKIYRSAYGPTFQTEQGFFAWRFVVAQDIRAIEQWYRMNKAQNYTQFRTALEMQAIPSTNIVYADRQDTIFFISNAKAPIRDTSYQWRTLLPGNTAATNWETYYPIDSLPQVLNPSSGYVYNTNNTPYSASAPLDNPPLRKSQQTMSFQLPDMENSRSLRFQELIASYDKLSYEDFKRIKFDRQYSQQIQSRDMMNLNLLFELDPAQHPKLSAEIQQLTDWDRSYDIDNQTAPLFICTIQQLIQNLRAEGRYQWRGQITKADAHRAISGAKAFLLEHYGSTQVRLGDFQRHRRGTVDLPLAGGPDVLAAMHSTRQPDGTYKGMAGESYIELVRFGPEGIEIETIHAYGSSEKPDSPHYTDQMERFVRQELKQMTLNKQKVLQQAKQVYAPRQVLR